MKTYYIVKSYGGQWEDAWTSIEAVTEDKAKAEAYVEKMSALHREVDEADEKLQEYLSNSSIVALEISWDDWVAKREAFIKENFNADIAEVLLGNDYYESTHWMVEEVKEL